MRIIVQKDHLHWLARFADDANGWFSGNNPFDAARLLIENSPERGLSLDEFEPDPQVIRWDRLELMLAHHRGESGSEPCPECDGTGKYIGLNAVEVCQACGGD